MTNRLENFVEKLAITEVTPNVYNQYNYKDRAESKENAIRRNNLLVYLKMMQKLKPQVMLVGEAPGYRGCRLTGVPFTSEHLLMNNMKGLCLFGKEAGFMQASGKEKLLKEATATIIWETLLKYDVLALAWNAFPFHPHKDGKAETNRTPTKAELIIGEKALMEMIDMFHINQVVAVGNKAEQSLRKLNISACKVRHPAQGGKEQFVEGIRQIKEILL
ncbi:MAG: uracil-DNA glycosylase-like protein [Clostridia bacterium]|jgi:uracil-DNA glycosylase|nr:uracil-DNA glycosylase-like protein [Clostridia bacterium]